MNKAIHRTMYPVCLFFMSGLSHTNHIYKQDKYDMKAKGSGKKDEDCVLYPKLNQPSNRPSFQKEDVY